jgi:ribosomal protein S18 acetylase RimI-like enzyme
VISRVGLADLDALLPLMRGYCDFYEVSPSDAALRALALTLIEHPDTSGVQLIARDNDDSAIGFATIFWSYSTLAARAIGVMNDLYVTEAARGKGIGAELIRACKAECAARGVEIMEWETAPENTRAQSLYDSFEATRSEWVSYTLEVTRR